MRLYKVTAEVFAKDDLHARDIVRLGVGEAPISTVLLGCANGNCDRSVGATPDDDNVCTKCEAEGFYVDYDVETFPGVGGDGRTVVHQNVRKREPDKSFAHPVSIFNRQSGV